MAYLRIGSMVNSVLASAIATLGSMLVAWLIGSLRRWLASGFEDIKLHLTRQDDKIENLGNRLSKVEGRMDEWQTHRRR